MAVCTKLSRLTRHYRSTTSQKSGLIGPTEIHSHCLLSFVFPTSVLFPALFFCFWLGAPSTVLIGNTMIYGAI